MAATVKRRTQVEAIDDLAAQMRLANVIAVLGMGLNAIEHDAKGEASSVESTAERARRRNRLRAEVRAAFGSEEGS